MATATATSTTRPEDIYLWRIQVWKEVADASRGLPIPPTEKISRTNQPLVRQQRYAPAETHISVVDADCIEVAQQLMMTHPGSRPVVLNLSDDAAAGGCVFTGSGAQEECFWRRTGLCHTQKQKFYPLCTPSPSLSLL